mgnify:CR=1 FL=1|jgi:hypothetical protein|tara:strand:- start:371 stop:601 length:231 start_codon:yes stop_codon:yes gene_type:complete
MTNYILTNKLTGVKEILTYADLQNRMRRNRMTFFQTYRLKAQVKKSLTEKLLLALFVGVSSIAVGLIFIEGFVYFI